MDSFLRIHGDNIIECERALLLIAESLSAEYSLLPSPPYLPKYEIRNGQEIIKVDLLAGHNRWGVSIQNIIKEQGASLRELADAIVTRITDGGSKEEIIFAMEFCSALPAGNNAWQRNGRALAYASAHVPYLYFAEIGGAELDGNRVIKSGRFPNPVIPFSYLTAGQATDTICAPIYAPSPSATKETRETFQSVFGIEEGKGLIHALISGTSPEEPYRALIEKSINMVIILSSNRKRVDTVAPSQWHEFLEFKTSGERLAWLEGLGIPWGKKTAGKVQISSTFNDFAQAFKSIESISIGAKEIPICVVPASKRLKLREELSGVYKEFQDDDHVQGSFLDWISANEKPLLVVWITGFKPLGEDSRPDRGLVPLARMLFGSEVELLSIVSGPARPSMITKVRKSSQEMADQNGLWEAIINLSNAVLVDSATSPVGPFSLLLEPKDIRSTESVKFDVADSAVAFSEHDVDTAIHTLFSGEFSNGIFESMCNPPGGDWSGMSLFNVETEESYRWTSLPRVSHIGGKRPDHIIQLFGQNFNNTLLSIESKTRASDLEAEVGPRLKTYVQQLIDVPPTISQKDKEWEIFISALEYTSSHSIISGGAFCWVNESELENSLIRGDLDFAMALEFKAIEEPSILHLKVRNEKAAFLVSLITELMKKFAGRLVIQVD